MFSFFNNFKSYLKKSVLNSYISIFFEISSKAIFDSNINVSFLTLNS